SAPTLTWGIDAGGRTLTSPSTTTYMYDLLGNLLQVSQGAQTRGYAYDTLSRVTSIATPETGPSTSATGTTNIYYTTSSGTLCAGDTSLPCRVIDPRNIAATFSYDALNRLTSKAYSDGTTPSVAYCYDNINAACVSGFSSS